MKIVNIHEAKTHLSRLLEDVVEGEAFIIVPLESTEGDKPKRLGFFAGRIVVPADFNTMPLHASAGHPDHDR
jgi:antitoxin (DNA-binding transcriptional repressor) of toxin-antitoxin stability system